MELGIHYFPQTDTLYIGTSDFANEGYDIDENLIAHANEDGEVVGITMKYATELLVSRVRVKITRHESSIAAKFLLGDAHRNEPPLHPRPH